MATDIHQHSEISTLEEVIDDIAKATDTYDVEVSFLRDVLNSVFLAIPAEEAKRIYDHVTADIESHSLSEDASEQMVEALERFRQFGEQIKEDSIINALLSTPRIP